MKSIPSGARSRVSLPTEVRPRVCLRAAVGAAGLAVLAGTGLFSPGLAPAQKGFTETAEVVAIEVPVQVVLDGQPVRGLTADNFEVYEGRKKQPVTSFEVLDLTSPASLQRGAVPASARRHFLLLFDLSFAEPKSVLQARRAATELVLNDLHPTDLVAVATYTLSKGPQLALGFTPDREQVRKAVETLGVPELIDRTPDPLRLVAADFRDTMNRTQNSGRKAEMEAIVLEQLEEMARQESQATRQVGNAQVAALSRSMSDLARLMNSVGGRKHVVYLSEGFDSSLLLGTSDQAETQRMNDAAASGEIYNVQSEARFGSTESVNDVEKMLEEFRRADCVIQAVDIGGLRGQGDQGARRASGRDSLFNMAKSTGGEMYENFNDLGEAMGQMLQRTGVTYVLAFQPDDLKLDGGYHRIKVELKNAPRGARVVHKPGYYAPRPYAQRSAFERVLDAGSQILGEEAGSVSTAVLAAPFQFQPAGKAYVPVVIEVSGPSLLAGKQGAALPAEIYAYAFDSKGNIQDFFTQTVGLDVAKVEGQLRQSGLKFFGHLELPPGDYNVRVLVRNGTTGASGLRVVPVTVPAVSEGRTAGPVLLPPFFPEPPGKWLMVRENPRGEQQQAPYPFMLKQQPYIPASLPVLAPGQEAQVALVGYNLGAGDLKLAAKVLTADGKEVGPGELKVVERENGPAPDRLVAAFKPPQQPGEYRLVVTLAGAAGNVETSAPFVVGGARGGRG